MKYAKKTTAPSSVKLKSVSRFASSSMTEAGIAASTHAVDRAYASSGYVSCIENGVIVRKYPNGKTVPVK